MPCSPQSILRLNTESANKSNRSGVIYGNKRFDLRLKLHFEDQRNNLLYGLFSAKALTFSVLLALMRLLRTFVLWKQGSRVDCVLAYVGLRSCSMERMKLVAVNQQNSENPSVTD